ncbi:threonine--tRNA ligase [Maricaulis sp.]|uniref:threonine--tRNA ligase n=1 Tax=Maricaulis sp. TaxID=1486257 RepID=UPI0025DF57F8|nr:threonine--tRNA ligase [Maricaulis sp.]MDF1769524.1 threonine--tRNA ligase [Maricaulis sp.]
MINVTLPDGSVRELPDGASPMDLAEGISKSLAKAAIIAQVDGQDWDLKRPLDGDAQVAIITRKDDKALEVIRHDTAHILAQAVQDIFPGTQVTIGPAIEDGFYYDFAREEPFSPEDFDAIEKRMAEIVDADLPFEREVWDRNDAIAKFEEMGESYKAELIRDLPEDETITIYRQGDWFDLCLGPHLPSTGKIGKAFKLMKVAGAYWRGDHRNAMLQRIYGTAWSDEKQLKAHLHRLEEAEKRDHRRLGKQMELFHFQEEAQGQVFWHPNGWRLYRTVTSYMRRRLETAGYVEIKTPQLMDRKFWEASGHWDKYRENMFISSIDQEEKVLAVKPMNCPCHVQVFNQGQKSYRDLPLRMAEFGSCHRYEPSGSLHGLMRVRGFVQDDAHIFCTVEQITQEVIDFCELLKSVYADFGFEEPRIKFSDRPEQRVGSDEVWDRAEASLKAAAEASGLDYEYNPGDGAFYGPKLDFVLKDAIGREWQTGTIQCDFNLPERLDASFIGDDSEKHRPVMLHRAILGSLERFLGVLIESYAGKLPFWLAPRQVVIATITSDADGYAETVKAAMLKAGLHAETDLRNEKINYKVREHSVGKVPVIAVVGRKEAEEGTLALRFLGEGGKTQEILPLDEAIARLSKDAKAPDLKRA